MVGLYENQIGVIIVSIEPVRVSHYILFIYLAVYAFEAMISYKRGLRASLSFMQSLVSGSNQDLV